MSTQTINIGLIGAGTIGGGVVKIFHERSAALSRNVGCSLVLRRIVDTDESRFSSLPVGEALCSSRADDILNDNDIDIVIELVGGTTFARDTILQCLRRGKHVVTANKALIAEYGPELFQQATQSGASLYFEAAVGGGIPVIKTIREALVGNRVFSVKTLINGTCNYILTRMTNDGLRFEEALARAQRSGYAEADPTLDVNGGDSGHKVAIMASLIHDGYVPFSSVSIEGIERIAHDDIVYARDLGYCIKLLGIIKSDTGTDALDVRVHPAMLHRDHILASVSDVFNAVLFEGDAVGPILLYGRGAGEMPTASAVVADIVDVARNCCARSPQRISVASYTTERTLPVQSPLSLVSRYYIRFTVKDQSGVLAVIARHFGEADISIASVLQKEGSTENGVPVIFLTHPASEQNVRRALAAIELNDFITGPTQLIRIEE